MEVDFDWVLWVTNMSFDKKVWYVRSLKNDSYCCKTNNVWWDFILDNLEHGFNLSKKWENLWRYWRHVIGVINEFSYGI